MTFKALEKCSAKRNETLFQSRHSHIWKYKLRDKFDTKDIKTHLSIGVLFDRYFKKLWGCVQGFKNGFQFTEYNAQKNLNRFCKTHPSSLY